MAIEKKFKLSLDEMKRLISTLLLLIVADYKISNNKLKEFLAEIYNWKQKLRGKR